MRAAITMRLTAFGEILAVTSPARVVMEVP
jgi:hypothetical protein